jgi:hypothetical protein
LDSAPLHLNTYWDIDVTRNVTNNCVAARMVWRAHSSIFFALPPPFPLLDLVPPTTTQLRTPSISILRPLEPSGSPSASLRLALAPSLVTWHYNPLPPFLLDLFRLLLSPFAIPPLPTFGNTINAVTPQILPTRLHCLFLLLCIPLFLPPPHLSPPLSGRSRQYV